MSLEAKIVSLAQAIGADIKTARTERGTLSSLSTTAKSNLVAAINELYTSVQTLSAGSAGINDAAGDGNVTETWSANKIFDTIEAAKVAVKNDLTAGASAALDTLSEFATALGNDPNFATTIATGLSNRVRFDAAQTLDATQKAQACANIGVGNPEHDFVGDYNTSKA